MHATTVITDQRYLDHRPGEYHPESPQRLERIYRMLKDADISGRFTEVQPRAATREELALNHSVEYVERIAKTAGKAHTMLDPDTHTSAGSWEAAIHAAGGVLVSLDMIIKMALSSCPRNDLGCENPGWNPQFGSIRRRP